MISHPSQSISQAASKLISARRVYLQDTKIADCALAWLLILFIKQFTESSTVTLKELTS